MARASLCGIRALAVSPDGKWLAAGGLYKATNPLGAVHEPLVLQFNWESQKVEKQQIADGIPGGVIWRLRWLGDGSLMLIGVDLIKDVALLELAYDDPAGVTAAFNLNLLERINRELGGTIPVDNFTHRAIWNDVHARIEMHLVAACDMAFAVDGRAYAMAKGETIHSENSHKYGPRDANLLLRAGGWTPIATWDDADPGFALILAEATEFRSAP